MRRSQSRAATLDLQDREKDTVLARARGLWVDKSRLFSMGTATRSGVASSAYGAFQRGSTGVVTPYVAMSGVALAYLLCDNSSVALSRRLSSSRESRATSPMEWP
jgi:hypothetical protein